MSKPLVSIIVPTKNSSQTLEACLRSLKEQSYQDIEIIVVDNFSTDTTQEIARKYTEKVFARGPERSPQRNYGVSQASGVYVAIIDSDMELSKEVVQECVKKMQSDTLILGLVIPEESFGEGFWAQCKKLERSFYVGVPWMEAARFFTKEAFERAGGYNESMVSGEDWDLSQRIEGAGKIDRIDQYIYHNEGRISLAKTLKKKFYYAKQFKNYLVNNQKNTNSAKQTSIIKRYKLFLSKPLRLFANPVTGLGMLFMKTAELAAGFLAIYFSPAQNPGKLNDFIKSADLEESAIVGFYGGTNFGDELLLEVLQEKMSAKGVKKMSFYYSRPDLFETYHNSFGYTMVSTPLSLFKAMLKSKNILIGGGGLWGIDFNSRIFVLSLSLFILRFVMRKKVYLLGVGYYNSTPMMGNIAAFLAGKSANQIYVRDNESFKNFSRISANTYLDTDIAYLLDKGDFSERKYNKQLLALNETVSKPVILVSLRGWYNPHFRNVIGRMIANHPDHSFIVTLLENQRIFLPNHEFAQSLERDYKNVKYLNFTFNPLDLFAFVYNNKEHLKIIAPQLHAQIMADITGVTFLPVYYDNKNLELFRRIGMSGECHIDSIHLDTLGAFI